MQLKKIFPLCFLLLALTLSCKKKEAAGPTFLVEGTISYEAMKPATVEAESDAASTSNNQAGTSDVGQAEKDKSKAATSKSNVATGKSDASTEDGQTDAESNDSATASDAAASGETKYAAKIDSITQILAFVQRANEAFDVDTVPVVGGRFSFRHATDSLVKVSIVAGDRFYDFYVAGEDTIRLTLAPDSLLMSGNDSPYARWSLADYDGVPGDTLNPMPQLIRDEIRSYFDNRRRGEVGRRIPFALMKDIDGNNVSSVESKGCYRLVSFWASWDSLSVAEVKRVAELSKKMKGKAIDFINVSVDTNDSIWRHEVKALGLPGRNVRLKAGMADEQLTIFGVTTLPQNLLLDVNSVVQLRDLFGPALEERLKEKVTLDRPKEKNK